MLAFLCLFNHGIPYRDIANPQGPSTETRLALTQSSLATTYPRQTPGLSRRSQLNQDSPTSRYAYPTFLTNQSRTLPSLRSSPRRNSTPHKLP